MCKCSWSQSGNNDPSRGTLTPEQEVHVSLIQHVNTSSHNSKPHHLIISYESISSIFYPTALNIFKYNDMCNSSSWSHLVLEVDLDGHEEASVARLLHLVWRLFAHCTHKINQRLLLLLLLLHVI